MLTVGLPLVSSLRVDHLGGIIAHALGHLSQTAGFRFGYLITSINMWFERIVCERDRLDDWLEKMREQSSPIVHIVFSLMTAAVGLRRQTSSMLMKVGLRISAFLFRQMDYDADRHAARLVGDRTFIEILLENRLPNEALALSMQQLVCARSNGFLVSDLPELTAAWRRSFTNDEVEQARGSMDAETADPLSTHPSDKDRLVNVQREGARGVLHLHEPASVWRGEEALFRSRRHWPGRR